MWPTVARSSVVLRGRRDAPAVSGDGGPGGNGHRPVPRAGAAGGRWDGNRLQGRTPEAQAQGRHQGPELHLGRPRRRPGPLSPRSPQRLHDQPSKRLCGIRFRRDARGPDVPGHGADRRKVVGGDPEGGGGAHAAACGRDHDAGCPSAGGGAREGHRPSRSQAGQHHGRFRCRRRRRGKGGRLRHRKGGRRPRRSGGHQGRPRRGHSGVHESGAPSRGRAGSEKRRVLAGRGVLPDAHGPAALRKRAHRPSSPCRWPRRCPGRRFRPACKR